MNDLKGYFIILYKQKKIIILSTILFGLCLLSISYVLNNKYESESIILVKTPSNGGNVGTINNFNLGNIDVLGSANKGSYLQRSLAFFYSIELARIIEEDKETLMHLFAVNGYDNENNQSILNNEIYNLETDEWSRNKPSPFNGRPLDIEILRELKSILNVYYNSNSGFIEIKVRSNSPLAAYQLAENFINFANNFIVKQDLAEIDRALFLTDQLASQNIANIKLQDSLTLIREENLKKKIYIQSNANFPLQKVQSPYVDINRVFPNRIFFILLGFILGFIISSTLIILRLSNTQLK